MDSVNEMARRTAFHLRQQLDLRMKGMNRIFLPTSKVFIRGCRHLLLAFVFVRVPQPCFGPGHGCDGWLDSSKYKYKYLAPGRYKLGSNEEALMT